MHPKLNSINKQIYVILGIQMAFLLAVGISYSYSDSGTPITDDPKILMLFWASILIFQALGVIGLLRAFVLRKKSSKAPLLFLFIISVLYVLVFPPIFATIKIAGIFNPEWTLHVQNERALLADKKWEDSQKNGVVQDEYFSKMDKIFLKHYEYYQKEFSTQQIIKYIEVSKTFTLQKGIIVYLYDVNIIDPIDIKNNPHQEQILQQQKIIKTINEKSVTLKLPPFETFTKYYQPHDSSTFMELLMDTTGDELQNYENPLHFSEKGVTFKVPVQIYFQDKNINASLQ